MILKFCNFLLAICLMLGTAYAQEKVIEKPTEGDIGLSIVVDGLIDNIQLNTNENNFNQNILFGKYYLKDDLVLRMGFGLNSNQVKRETSITENEIVTEKDSSASQTALNLSAGIEKHLTGTKRLDPFVFTQVDFAFIGKLDFETETRTISSVGTSKEGRQLTQDGGFGFALNLGGGFNYFIANNFSVGSEFYFGLQHLRQGGNTAITDSQTDISGNIITAFDNRDDVTKSTIIAVSPSAIFNISYFF